VRKLPSSMADDGDGLVPEDGRGPVVDGACRDVVIVERNDTGSDDDVVGV
jgi:hypothetical protein